MKGVRTFIGKCLVCLSFILFTAAPTHVAHAQTWPVSVNASINPQFTGYWTDYSNSSSTLLPVSVILNDINLSNYQVNLVLTIEGPDYTLTSTTPLSLNPGEVSMLPAITLFSPLKYSNGMPFDAENCFHEGSYMMHIVVYDAFHTDRQVSNEVLLPFYFNLKEPPYLIEPANRSLLTPLTPQFISFSWIATEVYTGDPSWTTSYEFSIYRVPPGTMDTMSIVNYGVPVHQVETNNTTYVLGPDVVELDPFSSYVWRVRAKSSTDRGIYKNNGYSEAFTFKYGDPNAVIAATIDLDLSAQGQTHRMGICFWSQNGVIDEYHLQVRKKGTQNWFDYYTTSSLEKINNLEPQTTYEARLRGEGSIETDWTDIKEFTTKPVPNYDCNNSTMPMDGLAANPLPAEKAHPGLIIQSGQFEVFATSITPLFSPGHFSGEGYAIVFGVFPLAVEWQDIYINDNNRQMSGVIEAKTKGIDAWAHDWDVAQAAEDPVWVQGTIDSVWINGNEYCYTFDDGTNTQTVCNDYPGDANVVVLQDDDGNQYVITIYPEPSSVSGPHNYLTYLGDSLAGNDSLQVTFSAASTQQFGFDKKEHVEWILNYEPIRLGDSTNYFVPWKSIGKGQTDEVVAHAEFAGLDENRLAFKDKTGNALSKTGSGGTYTITVPSNAQCVYAWYGDLKLGKLNVVELDTLSRRVVLVPVNGATINAANLQSNLNTIYAQANVSWTVSTAAPFSFDLGSDGLEAADATLFSKYSPEMRALRDSFRTQDTAYDKNAYYLFVVPNFNDPAQLGYMVRGRAVGFLAAGANAREAAHELGHGAFGLEHTFPDPAEGTTSNLMDYSTGTQLHKKQWDAIHSKMPVFNWLDEEEDGSSVDITDISIMAMYEGIIPLNEEISEMICIAPSGVLVTVANNLEQVSFSVKKEVEFMIPDGVLLGFKNSAGKYSAIVNNKNEFLGYARLINPLGTTTSEKYKINGDYDFYHESLTNTNTNSNAPVYIGKRSNCKVDFYYTQLSKFPKPSINNTAAGPIITKTDMIWSTISAEYIGFVDEPLNCRKTIPTLTENDLLYCSEGMKFNPYGQGGLLVKMIIDQKIEYFYCDFDAFGQEYYLIWNDTIWEDFIPVKPEKFDVISEILGICKDMVADPHFLLSSIGSTEIPILSWAADAIDGVLYLVEGDEINASLSFASIVIPNVIVKSVTLVKKINGVRKTIKLNEQLSEDFIQITRKLQESNVENFTDESFDVAQFLEKNQDKAVTIRSLHTASQNAERFSGFIKKLKSLPDEQQAEFLVDVARQNVPGIPAGAHLSENMASLDAGMVDAWRALHEFSTLRVNSANLETISKIRNKFTYNGKTGQEALEEIFSGHASAQKFIDNFKKYDEIIGEIDNITITGIKSSSEVRILNNSSQVGKVVDGNLFVNYSGFGGDIVCDASKTTTCIGKYDPPGGIGTKQVIDSKLSKSGENPGGVNILNDTRNMQGWEDQQIWDNVNEPWLRDAVNRGDDIRVLSNPLEGGNIFKDLRDVPSSVFDSSFDLADYLRNLPSDKLNDLSFFGREVKWLSENGYIYDVANFKFLK